MRISEEKKAEIIEKINNNVDKNDIIKEYQISNATYYRIKNNLNLNVSKISKVSFRDQPDIIPESIKNDNDTTNDNNKSLHINTNKEIIDFITKDIDNENNDDITYSEITETENEIKNDNNDDEIREKVNLFMENKLKENDKKIGNDQRTKFFISSTKTKKTIGTDTR